MGNALFYHLTRSPAERLLHVLVGKSLAAGWRVELRGSDAEQLEQLDEHLWQGEGFLPHGRAGGPHDARQPVLLTVNGQEAANSPACLMVLDGAEVTPAECGSLERVCVVFDGGDSEAVNRARLRWKALSDAGVTAEYWSEETGQWVRKR